MTTRRIMLTIATDETGERCSPECPHRNDPCGIVCLTFRDEHREPAYIRHARAPACIEAERAAREAEVSALERVYDIAGTVDAMLAVAHGEAEELAAEIARIRGGK